MTARRLVRIARRQRLEGDYITRASAGGRSPAEIAMDLQMDRILKEA